MTHRANPTEVDAYIFIKSKLEKLGWNTRNPSGMTKGRYGHRMSVYPTPTSRDILAWIAPRTLSK